MRHLALAIIAAVFVAADVAADLWMNARDNRGWDMVGALAIAWVAWQWDRKS